MSHQIRDSFSPRELSSWQEVKEKMQEKMGPLILVAIEMVIDSRLAKEQQLQWRYSSSLVGPSSSWGLVLPVLLLVHPSFSMLLLHLILRMRRVAEVAEVREGQQRMWQQQTLAHRASHLSWWSVSAFNSF